MTPPEPAILFENERVVAVNKPAGLLTIPDRFNHTLPHLVGWLEARARAVAATDVKLWKVHRLDKETSGVVLFAKDAETHRALNRQFERRLVTKRYLALVEGIPRRAESLIRLRLGPDPRNPGRTIVTRRPGSKHAETRLKIRERLGPYALLELEPITGRTHQLRVHLKAIGFPLAIDAVYGRRGALYASTLTKPDATPPAQEEPLMSRLTLHHQQLSFLEPATQESVTVAAPLPEDFQGLLDRLRASTSLSTCPERAKRVEGLRRRFPRPAPTAHALLLGLALALCAATPSWSAEPKLAVLTETTVTETGLKAFLKAHPLGEQDNLRLDDWGRSPGASVHIVLVRDRERPHVHRFHDGVACLVQGEGRLLLEGNAIALKAQDWVVIPRGKVHYFVNDGKRPAVAVVVFAPPWEAQAPDTVTVP
ncbi:MAG: cupin domain-containing protein [Candidatus Omnitrophica bacterium]|nr:cupin domain-containing protein [Candidatus Omnitrophota bacterium]